MPTATLIAQISADFLLDGRVYNSEPMKFSTHKWYFHECRQAEIDRVEMQYKRHLARIRGCLPAAMRAFMEDVNVHDALFRRVVLHPRQDRLTIKLRCGDLQVGYYDVDMTFVGVSLAHEDRRTLRLVANRKKTEVLTDEVDVVEDERRFEYAFLCWPTGEVTIRYRSFSYRKTPVRGRGFAPEGRHFVAANPRFRVVQ